jgi:hypothetical protein
MGGEGQGEEVAPALEDRGDLLPYPLLPLEEGNHLVADGSG